MSNIHFFNRRPTHGHARNSRTEIPQLKAGLTWVKCEKTAVPGNAIVGGRKSNGDPIYIGLVNHMREMIPGSVSFKKTKFCLTIPYSCTTFEYDKDFYVLCAQQDTNLQWINGDYGRVTDGAIFVDTNNDISIGRGKYCGEIIVGKVHSSHQCLYIPYDKSEIHASQYEILNVS